MKKRLIARICVFALALMLAVSPALAAGEMPVIGDSGLRRVASVSRWSPKATADVRLDFHEAKLLVGKVLKITGDIDPDETGEFDQLAYKVVSQEVTELADVPGAEKVKGVVTYTGKYLNFKAVGEGHVNIWILSGNYGDFVKVDVMPSPTTLTLDQSSLSLVTGESAALTATVAPDDALADVTWKSSKPAVAAVSMSGVVTAKKAGKTVITASALNGKLKAKCTVTVTKAPATDVKYRALCVGTGATAAEKIAFSSDAFQFASMLRLNTFAGERIAVKTAANPKTVAQFKSLVKAAFKDATEDDVNYLLVSSHGGNPAEDGFYNLYVSTKGPITATNLRAFLDTIPGRFVIVIDACFSGDMLNKGAQAPRANDFVKSFVSGNPMSKSGEMIGDKYKILCACSKDQYSWSSTANDGNPKKSWSLSDSAISYGAGWRYHDQDNQRPGKVALLADTNGDNQISLAEIYAFAEPMIKQIYMERKMYESDMPGAVPTQLCVWPENDESIVFART